MYHFKELDYHCEQQDEVWRTLVNNTSHILYYNGEGSLLYLINTWMIEDMVANWLQENNKNIIVSHTDKYWDYYYPELKRNNGPDIKITDAKEVYYIEIKHFYSKNIFKSTENFYSCAYTEGENEAKNKYGQNKYVCDYRKKGYNTKYMCFVLVKGDKLIIDFMDTRTGDVINSITLNNTLPLWQIGKEFSLNL